MGESHLFMDYRMKVISFGLIASWLALAIHAIMSVRRSDITETSVLYPLIAIAAALVILTMVPWRSALADPLGDSFVLLWCVGAILAVLVVGGSGTNEAIAVAFLGIAVFASAALVKPLIQTLVATAALIGYIAALVRIEVTLGAFDAALRVSAFVVTALLVVIVTRAVRRQMTAADDALIELGNREQQLAHREHELERLYDISRTIGYGSNLSEVLPELVGRVVAAVGAKTGIVLLYRPQDELLEVISPIWVNDHAVPVEDYTIALATTGIAQRAFTSGAPAIADVDEGTEVDTFLIELDASHVAAVPLQIESRAIGVLIAADKAVGEFNAADLAVLESLAGPSSLVLNQMARYEEARETGEKMAELAQLKTDFVSVVSHELRTPLTSIIGSLKTLQRPELSPEDSNAIELLTTAERQAQRLRSLIEDLLVMSRLDNQALPVRPEVLTVEDFLAEVVRGIPGATPLVSIDVSDEAEKLWVDPDHLGRITRNLIENALKYAPGSRVQLMARRRGTEIWLSIVDHGPGIPYELHEHIFDRFTQVDHHETRGFGGTGLGLSIVRGLTEGMGGRVWFEPTEGGGATFTVAMPARAGTRRSRGEH